MNEKFLFHPSKVWFSFITLKHFYWILKSVKKTNIMMLIFYANLLIILKCFGCHSGKNNRCHRFQNYYYCPDTLAFLDGVCRVANSPAPPRRASLAGFFPCWSRQFLLNYSFVLNTSHYLHIRLGRLGGRQLLGSKASALFFAFCSIESFDGAWFHDALAGTSPAMASNWNWL